jgi:hypothetical protein
MQRLLPRRCWGTPACTIPKLRRPQSDPQVCLLRANDQAKFPAVERHSGHSPGVVGLQAPPDAKKIMHEKRHMFRVLFREF